MEPDDKVCYCFSVSKRKIVNFVARERPQRASQISECLSAGTGCGWCIPFLVRIAENPDAFPVSEMTSEEYAAARSKYNTTAQPRNAF